jgi:Lipoprotein LpqB beta-propeller domain/Sporulation and spore germination
MSSLRAARLILSSALAVIAAAASLSGCATIPSASQVIQGPDIQNQLTNDYLYYSPAGPVKGESAADILAGFLNASTGPQNDFGVARQYLAPDFRTKWSPNQMVYIQRGGQKTKISADGSATVSLGISATVDAVGHYTVGKTGAKANLHFKLVQTNGQWRIASAPNALVMIRPVFEVIFHSYEVYFFDRTYRYLIPDLRWFPARASTATRLVGALLAGPSPWLSSAIGPLLSSETKLAIDAVTVEKKTALVNFSSQILQAPRLDLERFAAEIKATLTQLAGVDSVQIQADAVPQKVRDYAPASIATGAFAPVVLSSGALQQLIGPAGSRLDNASAWIGQLKVKDFGVTSNETGVALVNDKGVYAARLDGTSNPPTLVDTRKALLSPRYDNRGQLWLVGADGRIQIIAGKSKPVWLTVPWLKGHTLKAFTISPEGSRLAAVVVDADGTTRLLVAAIVRSAAGLATGFGAPIELSYGVGVPVSIEWAGESGIMVLADISATSSNVTLLNIGGDPREVGTLDHATTLMTSSDGTNTYVLDDRGRVMEYQGYTWTELQTGVIAAHMAN